MAMPGAWALLTAMRDCLCCRLEESGRAVCACFITPGAVAVWDFIGGDQAWVRLVNSYPSTSFPAPDSFAKCGTAMAWTVEVGVARCAPTPDAQGHPPTPETQEYVAEVQNADMELMREAIACCVG